LRPIATAAVFFLTVRAAAAGEDLQSGWPAMAFAGASERDGKLRETLFHIGQPRPERR